MHVGNYGCFVLETWKCRKVRKVHPPPLNGKSAENFPKKRAKISVFWPKIAVFSLAELGGTPAPPLTENHSAQKPLAERGGTPTPPLTEKIR